MHEPRRFLQVIMGPRQVGKTTLVTQLAAQAKIDYLFVSADSVAASNATWLEQQWEAARIKLAQCASEQMITTLIQPKYIRRFSNVDIAVFIQAIQQQGYGLYIVGLDNHTGFIYNDNSQVYFIHSTFVGTRNVQKENAAASWVLKQSKYKVLGKLSADEKMLERWIN